MGGGKKISHFRSSLSVWKELAYLAVRHPLLLASSVCFADEMLRSKYHAHPEIRAGYKIDHKNGQKELTLAFTWVDNWTRTYFGFEREKGCSGSGFHSDRYFHDVSETDDEIIRKNLPTLIDYLFQSISEGANKKPASYSFSAEAADASMTYLHPDGTREVKSQGYKPLPENLYHVVKQTLDSRLAMM